MSKIIYHLGPIYHFRGRQLTWHQVPGSNSVQYRSWMGRNLRQTITNKSTLYTARWCQVFDQISWGHCDTDQGCAPSITIPLFPRQWPITFHFKRVHDMKYMIHPRFARIWCLFVSKKTPNNAVPPQCQSQFTPKMKANTDLRLLSSLVWIY